MGLSVRGVSRRLVSVAVVAVLLVAGCSGFPGGTSSSDAPETVDPGEADLPPGVSESGVANASALAAAHDATLRTEGFVLNGTFVRDPPNRGNQTRRFHTVVAPGAERFRTTVETVRYATDAPNASVSQRSGTRVWSNATTTLRAVDLDGETAVSSVPDLPPWLSLTRAPQYQSYLEIGAFDVEQVVVRDGQTFTTLVADEAGESVDGDVAFDARFVVDERGVVHEATVSVSAPDGEADYAHYEVVAFGGSPERPPWVDDAERDG